SSRRRHTRFSRDWSSDVCSSDLGLPTLSMPLPELENLFESQETNSQVVFICQTGNRSLKAVELLKNKDSVHTFFSLKGGVLAWKIGRASCRERVENGDVDSQTIN